MHPREPSGGGRVLRDIATATRVNDDDSVPPSSGRGRRKKRMNRGVDPPRWSVGRSIGPGEGGENRLYFQGRGIPPFLLPQSSSLSLSFLRLTTAHSDGGVAFNGSRFQLLLNSRPIHKSFPFSPPFFKMPIFSHSPTEKRQECRPVECAAQATRREKQSRHPKVADVRRGRFSLHSCLPPSFLLFPSAIIAK